MVCQVSISTLISSFIRLARNAAGHPFSIGYAQSRCARSVVKSACPSRSYAFRIFHQGELPPGTRRLHSTLSAGGVSLECGPFALVVEEDLEENGDD